MNRESNAILSENHRLFFIGLIFSSLLQTTSLRAQDDNVVASAEVLKKLSLEELMNIEVTTASRTSVKLTEVASAIQVLTRNDILRSGATNIPEALRLVSNLQVAQLNANAWIISARGFNTIYANKLLVMIDGRTIYTPLFGGVLWEMQNLLLEDIDRIEVVSGPGGTLWGANAVNGVINIITRNTVDSQGTYVSGMAGDFVNHSVAARHGGKINDKFFYRAYVQNFRRNNTILPEGEENTDAWYLTQVGFRMDWQPSDGNAVVFQGDFYDGNKENIPAKSPFDGQNLMARWTHTFSERSEFMVHGYFDRYWRDDVPGAVADELQTFDIDFQHQYKAGKRLPVLTCPASMECILIKTEVKSEMTLSSGVLVQAMKV